MTVPFPHWIASIIIGSSIVYAIAQVDPMAAWLLATTILLGFLMINQDHYKNFLSFVGTITGTK